jgi:outer membrane protein assembly factor BamB
MRFSTCSIILPAILCGMLSWAPALSTAADPWPKFRGPTGDGIAAESEAPLNWDRQTNVSWRAELPGQGWSSPVIGGGIVYLSAAVPRGEQTDSGHDLVLILVDQANGEIRRISKVMEQDGQDAPAIHKKNSHASPTPLLTEQFVYVHFGHQGTACTDREGNVIWVNRDHAYAPVHGNGGSPILVGDSLISTADGGEDPFVLALDAKSGRQLWRTPRPVEASKKFSFATPTVIPSEGGPLVVAPGSDSVMALDADSGEIRWWAQYDGYSVVPKPVLSDSKVLVATGFGRTKLMAIRTGGSGDITGTHVEWEVDKGIPKTPSLIAHQGLVYMISDDGIALCLDSQSGEVVWRSRLGGNYSASPVLAGDRIYFTSEEGTTTVIRTGRQFEKLASNDLDEAILSSPAIADQAIFIRTDKAIYRIEE